MSLLAMLQASPSLLPTDAPMIAAVSLIVGAGKVWDHVIGRKKDKSHAGNFAKLSEKIDEYHAETRDLVAAHHDRITKVEHITTGVTGDNGLRGDVRELKQQMGFLRDRGYLTTPPDQPAPLHGNYRP